MLKRILISVLSLIMVFSFTACSSAPVQNSSPNTEAAANEQVPAQTSEAVETEAPVIFEEITLVDNEYCTFKITAIDAKNMWGYTLKAFLENKTDLELMFALENVSVNGFMCDPFWAAVVTPGMKANEQISFASEAFELNSITQVTDIDFSLKVYDYNEWTEDYLVNETFTIYPAGEDAMQPFVRTAQDGEIVLFDNENCTMIITGFDPENFWGYTLNVYLENKTDKNLMFSINEASVNGFMCDPFWADVVSGGKRSNTTISWMSEDFETNGITEVETLTLPITVYDADDWTSDYLIDDTFTVTP